MEGFEDYVLNKSTKLEVKLNRVRKMASFEEMEKDGFRLVASVGQNKKF